MKAVSFLAVFKTFRTPEFIILCLLSVLFIVFGRSLRKAGTRGMALIGIFCSLAGALGAAMRSLPGIQPTSFLVIMAGLLLGPGAGLAAGVISALLFDVLSVISIFTPWRMLFWGLMGLGGAYLRPKEYILAPYGFIWGFVFGWVMNSVYFFAGLVPASWGAFIISCVYSFGYDLSHAICNAALLVLFTGITVKLAEKNALYINKKARK